MGLLAKARQKLASAGQARKDASDRKDEYRVVLDAMAWLDDDALAELASLLRDANTNEHAHGDRHGNPHVDARPDAEPHRAGHADTATGAGKLRCLLPT